MSNTGLPTMTSDFSQATLITLVVVSSSMYFHFSKLQNIIKLQESVQPTHIQLYPTERIIITQASLKPGSRNH